MEASRPADTLAGKKARESRRSQHALSASRPRQVSRLPKPRRPQPQSGGRFGTLLSALVSLGSCWEPKPCCHLALAACEQSPQILPRGREWPRSGVRSLNLRSRLYPAQSFSVRCTDVVVFLWGQWALPWRPALDTQFLKFALLGAPDGWAFPGLDSHKPHLMPGLWWLPRSLSLPSWHW